MVYPGRRRQPGSLPRMLRALWLHCRKEFLSCIVLLPSGTRYMQEILSGNEAIARGAYEAGCLVACAYPGTPSTEILENTLSYKEINSSWAPNEKVALEVAIGASFGGGRSLCTMKHVGVNVAADPLFTLSYTGVRGGLVLVVADDPEMHSSQNEQD